MYNNKTWKIGGKLEVNRFGFGAMRIVGRGMLGYPKDEDEAIRVLQKVVALGINLIDTADSYGPGISEMLIAKALYPYPENLVIATKGGQLRPGPDQWVPDGHPEHLKDALEGSLKRLKLNQIKLYQLHRRDPRVPFDETLGYLKQAQDEGLIKYIGLSELDIESVKEAQKIVNVVSLQNKFSLDYRKWEPELQFCKENNIAFIPWNPINAGHLASDDNVQQVADKYHLSVFQLGLKWLYHHAPNILLIPGTSQVAHLQQNIAVQEVMVDERDLKILDQAFQEV